MLMVPSTGSREALVVCPPFPPWNLPSFMVESTLSSPCSRPDPPFLAKVWLSLTLTLSPLMIWYSGLMALLLFLLTRAAPAYLPTALSVAQRPLFPFWHFFTLFQYAQVFLLKPSPFCTLFAGPGSTNKSATSLFFYYLTLVLSTPPHPFPHLSCYLKLCGRSGRNCLLTPPVLSGYNGSPDTRFSWGMMQLTSWLDGECYLCSLQSFVVSLLLSLISTLVFSRTGGILSSSKFFDTQVPSTSTEELVLPRHARCVLSSSSLQQTQPSFRFLSL